MNEQVTSDPTTTTDGRKNNGTFAAGNQFGRGNPFARKVAAFRAALMEAVTEQDIKDIAAKLRDDAKAGDKAATKLLFQYVIGKPQPAVDPDTLDAQEMRTFAANSLPSEAIVQMQEAVPLGWLAPIWPIYIDCIKKKCGQHLADLFAATDAKEERRAERAREKAERKQRRDEALRGQPTPNGPSTTDEFADEYLEVLQDWLRGRLDPMNGDERS